MCHVYVNPIIEHLYLLMYLLISAVMASVKPESFDRLRYAKGMSVH